MGRKKPRVFCQLLHHRLKIDFQAQKTERQAQTIDFQGMKKKGDQQCAVSVM